LCILCSEEDPAKCHRGLLISRELTKLGIEVRHIRHDGSIESQEHFESRIPPTQLTLFSKKSQKTNSPGLTSPAKITLTKIVLLIPNKMFNPSPIILRSRTIIFRLLTLILCCVK